MIIKQHIAIVTGAEGSLGSVIADRLEARGTPVWNLDAHVCREGRDAIRMELGHYLRRFPEQTPAYIINNHGINHLSWIGTTPSRDEGILETNVMAPYWVVDGVVTLFPEARCRVVNIASQTYRVAQRTTALYCASKAALVQMTRVMARELAERQWIVNALAPGKIADTAMARITDAQVGDLRGWDTDTAERYALSLIPMGRFTTREEVTDMVLLMLLNFPSYVNGSVIEMTGGV